MCRRILGLFPQISNAIIVHLIRRRRMLHVPNKSIKFHHWNPDYLNLVEFQSMYWEMETVFGVLCQEQILIVSQFVVQSLWGRDDTWQISGSINTVADWVPVIATHCFQPTCFVGHCFEGVVVCFFFNCSRFPCVGKILKSFPSQFTSVCSR